MTMTTMTMSTTTKRQNSFVGGFFQQYEQDKKQDRGDTIGFRIVKIGAILAIFKLFEDLSDCMPLFGEFSRLSQDLCKSDYDSIKSRDNWLSSPKSGMWTFSFFSYDHMMIMMIRYRDLRI